MSQKIGTRFYINNLGTLYYIQDNENIMKSHKSYKKDYRYRYYEVQGGYEPSIEGLKQYRTDFIKYVEELKKFDIDYLQYENHKKAILGIFARFSKNVIIKDPLEEVDYIEFTYQHKCSNGGLISIDKNILGEVIDCYGYDVKGWYPYLLGKSNLQIPTKRGQEVKLNTLTFPLKYGYYKVSLSNYNNVENGTQDFYKVFALSSKNVYTHYSLNFINDLNKHLKLTGDDAIKMTLNNDDEFNAYLYDEKTLIKPLKIFQFWYKKMIELKIALPKNKLVKRMSSSLWGYITKFKRKYFEADDEYFELDASCIADWNKETKYKVLDEYEDEEGNPYFEVIDTEDLFEPITINKIDYHFSRLKSFLTSYSRTQIAKMILRENLLHKVIRVQTDSIVLLNPHTFTETGLAHLIISEDKTTLKNVIWHSVNSNNFTERKKFISD